VPAQYLGASFAGYVFVYAVMLVAYFVVLTHLAGKGVDTGTTANAGARA
jgi:hypothetical protein